MDSSKHEILSSCYMKIKNLAREIYFTVKKIFLPRLKITLHPPGEFISDQIRLTGQHYERQELDYCRKTFDTSIYVDIGANIGNHLNYFSGFGSVCIGFEPSTKNFELIKANAPNAIVYNVALGETEGVEQFVTYGSCMGNSNLPSSFDNSKGSFQPWGSQISTESVEMRTLDSFNLLEAKLIKIDVEGSELRVLRGARETLMRLRPVVWIEVHMDSTLERAGFGYRRKDIEDFFGSLGYRKFTTDETSTNIYYVSVAQVE
jgi:FkbM family methyltransferase